MTLLKLILSDPAFFTLSTLAILGAIGVIIEINIIRAGFALVICFSAVAGIYFALNSPYVGASQILISAVGITLIIVFALMLTSLKQNLPSIKGELEKNALSAVISFLLFITLSYALTGNKRLENESLSCPKNTEVIGLKLLGYYALPFELISVLLLVALIGAVIIAKKDKVEKGQ